MQVFTTLSAANRYANLAYRDGRTVAIERMRSSVHTARCEYVARCYVRENAPIRFDPRPIPSAAVPAHTLIALASRYAPYAPMASSALLCLDDAVAWRGNGDMRKACARALRSLRYSVGIMSDVYRDAERLALPC